MSAQYYRDQDQNLFEEVEPGMIRAVAPDGTYLSDRVEPLAAWERVCGPLVPISSLPA